MRLIDADKLLETLQDLEPHCDNKNFEHGMLKMMRCYMPQIINDEPTAYDVDKVVKEINEWTFNANIDVGDGTVMNHNLIVRDTAIEIVKTGGNINE